MDGGARKSWSEWLLEAGERFLAFCAENDLNIMNTLLEKLQVHPAASKHPTTKQAHMIYFVLMWTVLRCEGLQECLLLVTPP